MRLLCFCVTLTFVCGLAAFVDAAGLKVSLAIRETNGDGPIFDNGGSSGGIEWINRDGQTLTADGTWQLFTFTPATDTLTAFAGTSANSLLEDGHQYGTVEHIRLLNDEGITAPITIWIDDFTNTVASGAVIESFESYATGTSEVMFRSADFSGSTSGNILDGSDSAVVSDSMAHTGVNSLQHEMQFIDADPTRWVRLTTFNAPQLPNPEVRIVEPGAPAPTISFWAKAVVVPEPGTFALVCFAVAGLAVRRK